MHKKYLYIVIIIIPLVIFLNCKSKQVDKEKSIEKEIIINNVKDKIDKVYNSDKSMLLVLSYQISKNPIITYNYKVIDSKTKKELKKGVFIGTKIEWLNINTLKCTPYVGMVEKENDLILDNNNNNNNKTNYITIKID